MLQFTNHPMVDVGVAVIVNHFNLTDPRLITHRQLEQFAKELERTYESPYFRSYLSVLFPNSSYINPNMGAKRKEEEIRDVLYGYLHSGRQPLGQCAFCGQTAFYRAYRQHIPLLTGEDMINFFPSGRTGLEICHYCLLAIQAFPLGSIKVGRQAFFVHADDPELILEFAYHFRQINERNALLDDMKKAETGKYPKTLFMNQLLEVDRFLKNAEMHGSVSIYHLTNFGTKADISIYHLPVQILTFIHDMQSTRFRRAWVYMTQAGWVIPIPKKDRGKKRESPDANPSHEQHKNRLYEDIFQLPDGYKDFIRTHLLNGGIIRQYKRFLENQELELLQFWEVARYILKEVVQMREEKIEQIRHLADQLAMYLLKTDDYGFFRQFYYLRNRSKSIEYMELRNLLIKTNRRAIRHSENAGQNWELPVTFDQFIDVFERWEDPGEGNWQLGKDLVLLRMMEQLYERNWFSKHKEHLENVEDEIVEEYTETEE